MGESPAGGFMTVLTELMKMMGVTVDKEGLTAGEDSGEAAGDVSPSV